MAFPCPSHQHSLAIGWNFGCLLVHTVLQEFFPSVRRTKIIQDFASTVSEQACGKFLFQPHFKLDVPVSSKLSSPTRPHVGIRKNKVKGVAYHPRWWRSRWRFPITDPSWNVDTRARRSKHVRKANQVSQMTQVKKNTSSESGKCKSSESSQMTQVWIMRSGS